MKKILILALITISCLALTSCDMVERVLPYVNEFIGSLETLDSISSMPRAEWHKLVSETNYSKSYVRYEMRNGEYAEANRVDGMYSDTADYRKISVEGDDASEIYQTKIDGISYVIINRNDDRGFVLENMSGSETFSPSPILTEWQADKYYPYLTDKGNNTYSIEYHSENYVYYYDIKVDDGHITEMTETLLANDNSEKMITKYFDVRTTEFELPEYRIIGEEDPYTVTAEQWNDVIYGSNFTVLSNAYNSENIALMTYKQAANSHAYMNYSRYNIGDDMREEVSYNVIKDGVCYTVTADGDKFVGVANGELEAFDIKLASILPSDLTAAWASLFDSAVYDSESNSYNASCSYSENEATLVAIFFDGKIESLEFKFIKQNNECVVICTDFGMTEIDVPEYTLAE